MNIIALDTLKFTRELETGGLATKDDILALKSDIAALEGKMREQELRMTIKLGALIFIAAGVTGGIIITAIGLMFGKLL
jgi:hypothetical protein